MLIATASQGLQSRDENHNWEASHLLQQQPAKALIITVAQRSEHLAKGMFSASHS